MNFEKVPLDAEQLDSNVVKMIELDADRLVQSQPPAKPQKLGGVPRNALLKPADVEHRLGNQRFSLGDRVVYAQDSGKVPIATRGTLIGLTRTPRMLLLDIVFDLSFMSGTTLGDRCSPFRGSTVPAFCVLNVTDRQLITKSRAATSQEAKMTPTPLTVPSYGTPLGADGQGQLRQAEAPPPLRGGWKGAVVSQRNEQGRGNEPSRVLYGSRGGRGNTHQTNGAPTHTNLPHRPHPEQNRHQNSNSGHHGYGKKGRGNGTRGTRGGQHLTRGGYIAVDQGNPADSVVKNNPNFRPQNFSQVPPPANLNQNKGRGARGRGNGAGGNSVRGGQGANRGRIQETSAGQS